MATNSAVRLVAPARRIRDLTSRTRWVVLAPIAIATVLCWVWIVAMARDMYGTMDGAASWMMPSRWDLPHVALLFAMWAAMMAAMMLPSAVPVVLRYERHEASGGGLHGALRVHVFVTGYLAIWIAFGAVAMATQLALTHAGLLTPMMESATSILAAGLLLAAGVYQLVPFKRQCLMSASSPDALTREHRRRTLADAFRAGLSVGRSCLAANGILMLLLFAAGVMNLVAIVTLSIVVLIEKVAPFGTRTTVVSGSVLVVIALLMIAR